MLVLVHSLATRLAVKAQLLKPCDLAFAFYSRRMAGGKIGDQLGYAFA